MKALYFEQFGTADVLQYGDVNRPLLQPDEVLIETKSIGVNFADVYRRKGNYHLEGEPPFILGYEGAGVIVALGSAVTGYQLGDALGFADVPYANAQFVAVPTEKAIRLPAGISFDIAAALLLQGLTAQYLTTDSYAIQPGDTVLVHAAAGGVGQNLVQLAKIKGARVIGLTSSLTKAAIVTQLGADEVFLYDSDWVESVKRLSNGGVNVVYDAVGSTLTDSFSATKIGGHVVFYGMAGGDPLLVDPRMLMDTSKTLTGGDLWNILTSASIRQERADYLFALILSGQLQTPQMTHFPLAEGANAHRLLESRQSSGKLLLHV